MSRFQLLPIFLTLKSAAIKLSSTFFPNNSKINTKIKAYSHIVEIQVFDGLLFGPKMEKTRIKKIRFLKDNKTLDKL